MAAYRTASRLFPGSHLPVLCIGMEYQRTNNLLLAEQFYLQVGGRNLSTAVGLDLDAVESTVKTS